MTSPYKSGGAKRKQGVTREIVRELYFDKGFDPRTIALRLGMSVPGVHYHLRKLREPDEPEKQAV